MELRLVAFAGYALAALAFAGLGLLIALRGAGGRTGRLLLAAIVVETLWAAAMALSLTVYAPPAAVASLVEGLRPFLWTAFLASLSVSGSAAAGDSPLRRTSGTVLILAAALATASIAADLLDAGPQAIFGSKMLAAVFGMVWLEQVTRNTPPSGRWAIKFLIVAMLAMFGFDLVMYSEALLFSRLNPAWWAGRGYANLLLVPLLAIAAARNRDWRLEIRVSRAVVFHTATLTAVGAYLILVALGGWWVRVSGGSWGEVGQALLVFAALVGMLVVLASGRWRARLRVFLAKNFFRYRYDYRSEWLRLTQLLAQPEDAGGSKVDLPTRAILGLAQLVESPSGAIWLADGSGYALAAHTGGAGSRPSFPASDPLPVFLRNMGWVVDLAELRDRPQAYEGLSMPAAFASDREAWIVVPLLLESELLGFVALDRPLAPVPLDWETRDLLKAAARQIASYLAVRRAVEQLVQARQFESFNRMSAFVVHDLKNLVAQLTLLLRNADRHRDNPEFQADMLDTVQNVNQRMQGLLMQLRAGTKPIEQPGPVPVADALAQAVASKRGLKPEPQVELDAGLDGAAVLAHRDRLERVIGHLVQNAAEATSASGTISVRARCEGASAVIEVEDTGRGMSEEFLRTRLFQPFVSTKAHGMGIGTFESREYIRELGGTLDVTSRENEGTTFRIRLPLARAPEPGERSANG